MKKQYYVDLIGRLYKVLIFYEKYRNSFEAYVYNLKLELRGNDDFPQMQRVYYLLNYLSVEEITHKDVKKVTLDSIGIIDEILSNWEV